MPHKEEAIQHARKYFKRRALSNAELSTAIPELLKVIEDLYPLRNSESETRKYIEIWRKTKFKQSFNHTLETGEVVEVFNNDPDMSVQDRFVNWLFFYFYKQYEEKTDKTIGFAFALEILTQIYNCQKGNLITYELPNTNIDDVLDIIEGEKVEPVKQKLKEFNIATLENVNPALNSVMLNWQNKLNIINGSVSKIAKLQAAINIPVSQVSMFEKLNLQYANDQRRAIEAAQYTPDEVSQMRLNNDSRLYKTPNDVLNSYGNVWENRKYGCFVQYDGNPFGVNSIFQKSDGKGFRFYQLDKEGNSIYSFQQNNSIVISGFGEYILINWGKDLNKLFEEYTNSKYKKLAEQWKKEHFPTKIGLSTKLDLLKELKKSEELKWNEAIISEFFSSDDNEKLNQCMTEYFVWLDKCVKVENEIDEEYYIKSIKNGKLIYNDGWVNGKVGFFKDFDVDYNLRFIEDKGKGRIGRDYTEEDRDLPVLACGFVAWLIKHWGTDTQTIYSGYLQTRLNQYKSAHKNDADVLKRDLDSEFFEQYNSLEEKLVLQSEAIFEFISEGEIDKIKNYISNYFDFIRQYLPYKIYNSFDEAIRECEIEDKILLHSITKFLNPSYRLPINIFNDILQIKAMYLNEPSKCIKYIRDNYNTTADEYYILIHILKSKLDRDCDLQILLPDISAKKSLIDSFDDLLRSIRRKLTVHFDLLAGAVLVDSSDPQKIYSRVNITDEAALYFLSTQPDTRKYFCLLPSNVDELIEEYKFKQSVNANSDLSFKSKGQKSKHVKDDLNKQFAEREIKVLEFEQYFKPSFRGIGEYNINHFVSLIEDLKQNRSAKEFAEIALLIHESKHMNSRKPLYFTEWYQVFCECVGCEQKKYDPKDLRPIRESVKNLFGYLLI